VMEVAEEAGEKRFGEPLADAYRKKGTLNW
jgi:hypothetical protein